jgi:hypothetical protein
VEYDVKMGGDKFNHLVELDGGRGTVTRSVELIYCWEGS